MAKGHEADQSGREEFLEQKALDTWTRPKFSSKRAMLSDVVSIFSWEPGGSTSVSPGTLKRLVRVTMSNLPIDLKILFLASHPSIIKITAASVFVSVTPQIRTRFREHKASERKSWPFT